MYFEARTCANASVGRKLYWHPDMQKIFFTIIFISTMTSLFGQTEKASYKAVVDRLETLYNATQFDSIFAMFSDNMKKALPLDKTTDFFAGLDSQAGKITKWQQE